MGAIDHRGKVRKAVVTVPAGGAVQNGCRQEPLVDIGAAGE